LGLPSSLVFLFTHATLFGDPRRPSATSPFTVALCKLLNLRLHRRLLCWLDEAISSFRDCGLSYGLCDALWTLQSFRSMITHLLDDCNTRYEWLVRPYSIGTCTQSETPSFAWRTEDCSLWEKYPLVSRPRGHRKVASLFCAVVPPN